MARKSRFLAYVSGMKGQAEKPASSVKEKLSQMKARTKETNKKDMKEDK